MRLHRYLASQVTFVLLVAAPTLGFLAALLQTMRFLPLVAGAGLTPGELAELALLSTAALASTTLPAAAVIAVLAVLSKLETDGELMALRAAGAGPWQIGSAPAAVCAVLALASGAIALAGEPAAHGRLRLRFGDLLLRATVGSIRPNVISEPVEGLTVFAKGRDGSTLRGLFIDDRRGPRSVQTFATSATVSTDGQGRGAKMSLRNGAVHHLAEDGTLTRATFARLDSVVDLEAATTALTEILPLRVSMSPWELARLGSAGSEESRSAAFLLHRRLASAPASLGVGLLAVLLALWRPVTSRPWAIALGGCLVLAFHVTLRAGEAAMDGGTLSPAAGAWVPVCSIWLGIALWVAIARIRVLWWG